MAKLILRFFRRFIRDGELALLLVSLIIASGTVTGISIFVSRIGNTVMDEAANFLAADAKITGSMEFSAEWDELALKNNLEVAKVISFRSMAFADDNMQMTQVRAVTESHPLRGEILLAEQAFGEPITVSHGPLQGEVWLASRLFSALNIQAGDTIQIGEKPLRVSHAIIQEPDSAQSSFGFAPRVLMHIADVPETRVVQPGSRIDYGFAVSGGTLEVERFIEKAETMLGEHYRLRTPKEGNEAVAGSLERAESFLLLAGSLSVMLAGVAVALSARRFAQRQQANVALLKSFGLTPSQISQLYFGLILLTAVLGLLIGILLGWLLQWTVVIMLRDVMPSHLAPATGASFIVGALTAGMSLLAFCIPPLYRLRQIAPSRILRSDLADNSGIGLSALTGAIAVVVLVYIYSQSWLITGVSVIALVAMALFGGGILWLLVHFLSKSGNKLHGYWRIGLANLQRQRLMSILQIFVFSMVFLLLLVLLQIRTGMLDQWKAELPENAPNHFVFNIYEDELNSIAKRFEENGVGTQPFYPMTRGRVIGVNELSTKEALEGREVENNYERELNLTYSDTMGTDNEIVDGAWWDELQLESDKLYVSAEEGYAQGLGLKIGDTLHFSIAGEQFEAEVASIRSVKWDSMNPNFFMIFNKPMLEYMSANWLTSFYLAPDQKEFVNTLTREFPTLTLIELDQTLAQINSIIQNVSLAIEFILLLVLCSAFMVMLTSIQATLDERRRESALLRSFGASRKFVGRVLSVEFIAIGLMAGIFSVAGAEGCLYLIEQRLFNLEYAPHYWMWGFAPLCSVALILGIGRLSTLKVSQVPPLRILRA